MSWHATIEGEIATSPRARAMVANAFDEWMGGAGGRVDVRQEDESLVVRFDGLYRNLGRDIAEKVWKITQAFPDDTRGWFTVVSIDDGLFAASYRVEKGRVFERAMSDTVGEYHPPPAPRRDPRPASPP